MSKQRIEDFTDEYQAQVISDIGLANRWNLTVNAAFEHRDNKVTEDDNGGRIAAEFQYQITNDTRLSGRMPWFFSMGLEGSWATNMKSIFKTQAKN